MDVCQPRLRRRGFFLHSSESGEPDTGEHENPEGFGVRVRAAAPPAPRQIGSSGRSRAATSIEDANPQIRSGSVTGSRQRAHLPR
jgi:hypothetical protein